ncbi:MAG: helix-turn-helix domain-containing protein [Thermoprotei archaeon]|nr:helix-turn-helix domain-containing protein [Thermoprotei archaeon]
MGSDETFEAIAHPLRIKILKLLAERPMGFSELKRELGIKSSGKLDFHLKKLENLIALNSDGRYTLTKEGYAALQAITTIEKYGWQKRAYIINTVIYIVVVAYMLSRILMEGVNSIYTVILVLATLWFIYYSYWSIVKRGVFRGGE